MDVMLRQALRKHRELRNQVEALLLGDDGDVCERELRKWVAKRPCWVNDQTSSLANHTSRLCLLTPDLIIPATDGKENLSDPSVFPGWVDPDLERWGCNVVSKAKLETPVAVHELCANGTFQQIFGGQGIDLDQLCLTPHQIKQFVIKYPEHLHPQGFGIFFLFKVDEQFFVAGVGWSG